MLNPSFGSFASDEFLNSLRAEFSLDLSLKTAAWKMLSIVPVLPQPGAGRTLERWRVLAAFAALDMCLVKLLEAHYDALAIFSELGEPQPPADVMWAVWAAEPPDAQVDCAWTDGVARISGTKAWCSGADIVDRALVTARSDAGSVLVQVDLSEAGVSTDASMWQALGMGRLASGRVQFSNVPVRVVGAPGAYVERPGFWQGGAGIAACWFGGAAAVADTLRQGSRVGQDPHACAHLGAIDVLLGAAASQLREIATLIDTDSEEPHRLPVLRVRALLERCCSEVIDRAGRALGPASLCLDRAHALHCSDLAVFIRQSHAERDWAALGMAALERGCTWTL